MVDRDFFGFCITLKPLELKAIGELSQTRHLAAGETIYAPGDRGDTLYIINRGLVEAVRSAKDVSDAYLSRGDIFGDVEVLTELPRKYLVRTREPVSLQCFHRKDFAELIRRVPSFFLYLSEQLAFRLAQARDLALAQSHCLELSGSLSNFDLVTIYQTIVNSSQTGELRISNEKSDLISAFFFEKGQPRCGQFEHLTGEEAFWQLFLSDSLAGTFSFSSGDRPDQRLDPIGTDHTKCRRHADQCFAGSGRIARAEATPTRRRGKIASAEIRSFLAVDRFAGVETDRGASLATCLSGACHPGGPVSQLRGL